ncbi:MAG TPA: UDP-N-acetylmuramate--L-alanine ligase, partial [Patescibacteria group bacterium]|nr:UDP-N-acetylmuramate--L-alanine ligase [Patescibacteria group bacterium]
TFYELKNRGINIYSGFSPEHVRADRVIYSGAHGGEHNCEVVYAKEKGIATLSLAQALGELSRKKETLAVCGCHGKTTTTALAAYVLDRVVPQVSYAVGAAQFSGMSSGKWSETSKLFVVEADEYVVDPQTDTRTKFTLLSPRFVIATVFDYDHVDMYSSVEELKRAYRLFFESVPKDGFIIVNADDPVLCVLTRNVRSRVATYGLSQHADYRVLSIGRHSKQTVFSVNVKNQQEYTFAINLHGTHNALNATAVVAFCNEYGLDLKKCAQALAAFRGVRRRLELYYEKNTVTILDDYAHHPTEISATLQAVKASYPDKKIAVLFQPHTYSRTKHFLTGFVESLSQADYTAVLPIFASKREQTNTAVTSNFLVAKARAKGNDHCVYLEDEKGIKAWLNGLPKQHLVLLTMGAGDVYTYVNTIKSFFENYE